METRLSRAGSSRMRGDLEAAIEYLPGLASLALWCNFADTDQDEIAYTDGNTIYAGKQYEVFETKERRFICLHEILHIALCHPTRFRELQERELSGFDGELLNIAADAIINESLKKLTGLSIPAGAWTLGKIWECLQTSEDQMKSESETGQSPTSYSYSSMTASQNRQIAHLTRDEFTAVNRWSSENLYYFLKERCRTEAQLVVILAECSAKSLPGGDLRPPENQRGRSFKIGKAEKPKGEQGKVEQMKRDWQQRLSLLRGSVPELLERLAGELPRVETPWEQIFRNLVQTAFQEETTKNYSRPARRWLALERDYQKHAGVELPFAPDASKKRGSRLAVALDTSGSIDGELLGRFLAEIAALCAINQRNPVLLIGDAAVHKIVEIDWREASEELARIKYEGGGGTDFRPLIQAAAQYSPDVLVYLTDLFGETGEEPDFPVIWATHGIAGEAAWGDHLKLK